MSDDNLETLSLLWADTTVHSEENRVVRKHFHSTINQFKVFDNGIDCETYIHQSKNDRIILIVSPSIGRVLVPSIHSLGQITSIYVYHSRLDARSQKWASKLTKIRAIVNDHKKLLGKIRVDEPLPISIFNPVSNEERSATNINGGFLHFRLFIDELLLPRHSQTIKAEFVELCQKEYKDNHAQLTILQQFKESYVPERVLQWYTRDSFLYRILNKALRIQNIKLLFLLQFIIRDLCQQLDKLQRQQKRAAFHVFRGQFMSAEELNVLKGSKGQFISITSFFSTSLDEQVSLAFVSSESTDLCRVLFIVEVVTHLSYCTKPFANISSKSQCLNEDEVLFMIATVFRVIDIYSRGELTVIQMVVSDENYDCHTETLFAYMQNDAREHGPYLSIGHVLYEAGMYDQAEQFCHQILVELPADHPLVYDVWSLLGAVKKGKGELKKSPVWLKKAIIGYDQMGNHLGHARCLLHLADIRQMEGRLDWAMDTCQQALEIFRKQSSHHIYWVLDFLSLLGIIYFKQTKFMKAFGYYKMVLRIREHILPSRHPDIGKILNNIGNIFFELKAFNRALQYYKRALTIFEASLPSEHPSIAQTYYTMSLVHLVKRDNHRSLEFLRRAINIVRSTLDPTHPHIQRYVNTLRFVTELQSK